MAADLLEFTQANMSFNPFLLANAPRVDPGSEVYSAIGSNPQEIEVQDYMAFDEGLTFEDLSPPIMAGNGAGGLTSSVMYVISSI
jgi:hypothetical protein